MSVRNHTPRRAPLPFGASITTAPWEARTWLCLQAGPAQPKSIYSPFTFLFVPLIRDVFMNIFLKCLIKIKSQRL